MSISSVDTTNPATCRANPDNIQKITTGLQNCMRTQEKDRTNTLASKTLQLKSDVDSLRGNVMDSLSLGDTMFGQYGHSEVSAQVRKRNDDLQSQIDKLDKEIDKNQAIMERSNRDFIDVKHTLPERQPKKILHFIEDYTMALLSISYLFMTLIGIYVYSTMKSGQNGNSSGNSNGNRSGNSSNSNGFNISKFFQALGYSSLNTIIIGMVLYYVV